MIPEADTDFAARCRALCPGFRASERLPARKSELLAGEIDGAPVVAKRLARPNDVWAWYFARELAMYRAFAADPPPVRVPVLHAAADDVLVIERLPGAPVATRRSPQAILDDGVLHGLLSIHERFAAWRGTVPNVPPPSAVKAQLRARFLEDPTAPAEWIRDGLTRAARRKILSAAAAAAIVVAIEAHPRTAPSHGDLLLRNAIADGDAVGLVDWECAGPHLADWDLALLWTQLGAAQRPIVEAAACTSPARERVFVGLVAFALAREISFRHAFGAGDRGREHANISRITRELADVCARVVG